MTSEDLAARPPGRSGSRAILFIGLVLGVVAAVLIAVILSGDDNSTTEESSGPTTRIAVVAKEDVPARTRLTREMLEVKTFVVDDVDPESFSAVSQVVNRVTANDLVAGQVLAPDAVSATTGEGLTFSLTEGMRAISIQVSEVVIAGGNLSPGNHVDIVSIFEVTALADVGSIIEVFTGQTFVTPTVIAEDATLTFTLLQNVKVLAVAQDLTPETAAPSNGESESSFLDTAQANPRAGTVTLEVTPQQAQAMTTADHLGTLRLALRPFGDDEIVEVQPIIVFLAE